MMSIKKVMSDFLRREKAETNIPIDQLSIRCQEIIGQADGK